MDNNISLKTAKTQSRKNKTPKLYNLIQTDESKELAQGERYTVCSKCGKKFEQDFYSDKNRYSGFKTCRDCRSKEAVKKTQKAMSQIETAVATLKYTPYPWQQQAHKDFETHRFLVLACGARSGKDRYSIMQAIMYYAELLNENRHIDHPDMVPAIRWWIIGPVEAVLKQIWLELKQYFPKQWIVAVSESTMTMQTIGNGLIEVRSGYRPEDLVGVGLDLVTITEAARISDLETVWANLEARLISPGRGLERDRHHKKYGAGKAIINSSPMGKNYFYKMWLWGQSNSSEYDSDWCSYQLPSSCNPAFAEYLAEKKKTRYGYETNEQSMRRRYGERRFAQDFEASFETASGKVFGDFTELCVIDLFSPSIKLNTKAKRSEYMDEWKEVKPFHQYRGSYDPATGSSQDDPAFVIRDLENNHIVLVMSLYGKNYDEQYNVIAEYCIKYNHAPCVVLATGHTAVIGNLSKRNVEEVVINEQGGNKQLYVQKLAYAVQSKDLQIPDDGSEYNQMLIAQMNDYEEDNGKYSNKQQPHDDFVSALYANYYDYADIEIIAPYCGIMNAI